MKSISMSVILGLAIVGCGGGDASKEAGSPAAAAPTPATAGLSDFETKHGIGPMKTEIALSGEPDKARVEAGKASFEAKCAACHKLTERYVGPPLGDVLTRRSATYVANMILNPQEMTQKHPEAKKLFAEYMTQMPFQNVSSDEAMALLDYLRANQTK